MQTFPLALRRPSPVVIAIVGVAFLSLMDAAVKQVAVDTPTWQTVLLRYGFGSLFAWPAFAAAGGGPLSWEMVRAHGMRAVVIVLTAATFFYALGALPLAVTLALSFTAPIMIALMARFSLGEQPGAGVLAAIGIGFLGMMVVLAGELGRSGTATLPGIAAALASAFFYAVSMVSLKARTGRDGITTIVLLQNVMSCLIIAPFGLTVWVAPSLTNWIWFAGIGLLGTIGHLALAWAYGRAEASRIGAVDYTAFIWAVGLGFVFFAEVPSATTIAGALLIVVAAVFAARARTSAVQQT